MANEHIARLQSVGIGKETTAWTKVSAADWLPKSSGILTPVIETVRDTAWYGVIDEVNDVQPTREHSEINLEGSVTDESIGYFLLGALWTVSTTGSWPYTHAFTRANTNNHQSFSVWGTDPVGSFSSAYCMVESLNISVASGELVNYTVNLKGKKLVSESTPSVSYASQNIFRATDCNVYFADSEGWLSGASAVDIENINISIEKNLYIHQATSAGVDITSIHNQSFMVTGDFEALFTSSTYEDYVRNGTKKFMKIELINTDVTLSGGGNPTLSFTFGNAAFENWSKTSDNNAIVRQTIGFVGAFNSDEWFSVKATLINGKTSY